MPLAGVDGTNRFEYLLTHHALHHIAFCTGSQSAFNIYVAFKGCENDGAGGGRERQDVSDQFESRGIEEEKVDKHHSRVKFTEHPKRFRAGFGGTYNFHIRLQRHKTRQSFADDGVVVYTENANSLPFTHPGSLLHLTAFSSSILS